MTSDPRPAAPQPPAAPAADSSAAGAAGEASGLAGRLAGWAALWRAGTERTDARARADADEALRLPKPPGVFRLFFARHPWIVDWFVVAVFVLPSAATLVIRLIDVGINPAAGAELPDFWNAGGVVSTIVAVIGVAAVAVALRFRRAHPLVLVTVVVVCLVTAVPISDRSQLLAACLALYAVAVYASSRAAIISFGVLALALGVHGLMLAGGALDLALTMSLTAGFLTLVATLIGINVGNRKRYVEALLDRAAQLARERDQQALLAAAAERARIAREMHDIVAHSLTVIVALADGADATAARDPERARAAVQQVAETGRAALADMRVVLGVLAEASPTTGPATALEPLPDHGDLHAAVESFRAAGMNIRFTTSGAVPGDPALELTVYRIVQEALTNSLRYAPDPKHVTVRVEYGDTEVRLEVSDAGQAQLGVPSIGTGKGIIGMRERANVFGGLVEAGPTTAGGWRVRAVLPLGGVR